ncbi:MAG: acyl-CoA dehydrogenase family protein [Flavobacteriales bacterium]
MTKESAMAKYYASEVCVWASNEAVQIFGGYGYTKDFPWRSSTGTASCAPLGRVPAVIQKLVISRQVLSA